MSGTGTDLDTPSHAGQPPRRALLLLNPNSRSGCDPVDAVAERLESAGVTLHRETFDSPEEVSPDIVRRAHEVDAVIVCGGDGTLNSAAKGLLESGLPLGVIPTGTGNDLARTLSIPIDPVAAADVILSGRLRRIDLGDVNGRPFFNVASLGLSAELAEGLSWQVKRRWGRLGYALAAMRVLANARPFQATIHTENGVVKVRTFQIAVGNGRYYGGGMTVAEDAAIDDAKLDLYSLEMTSVWKLALMLWAFRSGAHGAWEEVRTVRGGTFEIRTRHGRSVNADGELVTNTPARFSIRPAAVSVYVPPD